MSIHLNCSSCSAPLDSDGATATVRCPYCDAVVLVPEALRAAAKADRAATEQGVRVKPGGAQSRTPGANARSRALPGAAYTVQPAQARRWRGCMVALFLIVLAASIAVVLIPVWFMSSRSVTTTLERTTERNVEPLLTPDAERSSFVTQAQELVREPTPPPTPGFATELARFGSEGIAPGYFDDARAIALDQQGRIYAGEYSSGRVQLFDEAGTWQSQWQLPEDAYVGAFVVDRASQLYAVIGAELLQFDGATGALVRNWTENSDQWATDGLALTPGGRIVLELDDDIVRLDADGAPELVIADAIEEAGGESEMSSVLAVDGLGNIFALATMQQVIYKFGPDGRFLDRFGGRDWDGVTGGGTFSAASSLAIDAQGRVYVGDSDGIQVFDNNGVYLALIDVDGFPFGLAFSDDGTLFVAARDKVVQYAINGPAD